MRSVYAKSVIWLLAGFLTLSLAVPAFGATKKSSTHHKRTHRRPRGQQKIAPQRVREIQEALIREKYLNSKADGVWGPATQSAMQRYQADNGWQSKVVPDSRALIKLGLGPDHDDLLNPESAMTSMPLPRTNPTAVEPTSSESASSGKEQ